MEITEIKSRLSLSKLIVHYGLKADKQNRLKCPFHDDKTPSLQLYYKTQSCFCFSTNCKTHGRSIDVIDFIMYYENLSKHQAIHKAQELAGDANASIPAIEPQAKATPGNNSKSQFLERMFTYFTNGLHSSPPAKAYLEKRGLDYAQTPVGYNSGQYHHGARKDEQLIARSITYGLLLDQGRKSRLGENAYSPFGKSCLCFALRDKTYQVVGLYFRSILDDKDARHFYLKDRQGLYPHYPDQATKRLILTESIIDAATLLEQASIKETYGVLALYGTNGFTSEHRQAITELPELSEIILFMDGDRAGITATRKYSLELKNHYPQLKISQVDTPIGEDINSLLLGHTGEILQHLIDSRTPAEQESPSFFSTETSIPEIPQEKEKVHTAEPLSKLDTGQPYNLKYQSGDILYQIKGFKSDQLDSLKVTLQIVVP